MRCGQDGMAARRLAQAICRYGQAGQRSRRPSWPQPEGTGRSGRISLSVAPNIESMRRRDPPRTASHIASVAHVPIIEIGSGPRALPYPYARSNYSYRDSMCPYYPRRNNRMMRPRSPAGSFKPTLRPLFPVVRREICGPRRRTARAPSC